MNQATQTRKKRRRQALRISNVDWRTYSRLLCIFEERPGFRLTYDQGELEIMSPRFEHDGDSRFLGVLVGVLTQEMGLPVRRGGATTMRRRLLRKGIEADECFWITNAHRMAGRRQLDLRTDPPPDLALEVDVTSCSLDRFDIYAALAVPEVWRLEGDVLTFHVLGLDGAYAQSSTSSLFPFLKPADLLPVLQRARQSSDENQVEADFRAWVRKQRATS